MCGGSVLMTILFIVSYHTFTITSTRFTYCIRHILWVCFDVLVKSNTAEEEEAEVKVMIRKVNQLRRERAIENGEDVSDSEDEEEHTIVSSLVINNAEQGSSCAGSSSTALTLMQENDPSNSAIMLHSSPAVDYFQSREYRGLKPDLGADELNGEVAGSTRKVEIRAGLYGTASGYKPMVTALSILDQEEESAANSSSTSD